MNKSPYKNWTQKQIDMLLKDQQPAGKTYAQCSYFCRAHLNKGFRPVKDKIAAGWDTRGKRYVEMHKKGMSYAQIAAQEGLTRQRVHAVIRAFHARNK